MANGFFRTTRGGGMFQAPDTQRQYEMANALRQQSMQPRQGFTAPGGYYVSPGIGAAIEPIAQSFAANRIQGQAEETQQRRMKELSEALRGQQAPPEMIRSPDFNPNAQVSTTERLSALEDNPQAQQMAMALRMQEAQREPEGTYQTLSSEQAEQLGLGRGVWQMSPQGEIQQAYEPPQQQDSDLPSIVREAQYAYPNDPEKQRQYLESYRQKSGTNITNVMGGQELTPGQEALDKAFVKNTYEPFVLGGGFADAQKNMEQLQVAIEALDSADNLTGPVTGSTPDFIKQFSNPESIDVREAVEEVVQRNLREVLGAQFTEKEGERLISRAYNPNLSEERNKERLKRLIKQIEGGYKAKMRAAEYFMENGTMRGFQGNLPSMQDFTSMFGDEDTEQNDSGGDDKGPLTESEREELERLKQELGVE